MLPTEGTVNFAGKSWEVGFWGFIGKDMYYCLFDENGKMRLIPAMTINWKEESRESKR